MTKTTKITFSPASRLASSIFSLLFLTASLVSLSARIAANEVADAEPKLEVMTVNGSYTRAYSSFNNSERLSVTREEIELLKPSSVTNLLRTLPGVSVTQQGSEGGLSFISLRGGEPNFTVVIIDGVKVNDPTNSRGGGFDLASLDPLLIESIDVFLGGFSSIYGSEALGGVISISTFDSDLLKRNITVEVGSDNAYAAALRWGGNVPGRFGYNIAAVKRQSAESAPGDKLRREQFNLTLFSPQDATFQWSGAWLYSEGDARGFPEDSGGDQWADNETPLVDLLEVRSFRQNNARIAVSGLISDRWTIDASVSHSAHDEKIDNPGIAEGVLSGVPPLTSDSHYQRRDISLIANYQSNVIATAIGAELTHERGEFESVIDFGSPIPADFEFSRDYLALFAEAIINLSPELTIGGSLRRDDIEEFQQQTYAFQASYILPADFGSLSFRYGEGFKVPSFFALGHPLVGNELLQPEESENFSISFRNDLLDDRLSFTASVFRNRFMNLVDFDPVLFTNVNRSRIDVEGIEGHVSWKPYTELRIDASATYSQYDSIEGVILRRRPERKYAASAFWTVNDQTDISLRAWYVDEFHDSSIPTGIVKSAAYHQLDVSVIYAINERLEFGVVLSNLTDNAFQEAVGFSNPGRQLRLSLTAKL